MGSCSQGKIVGLDEQTEAAKKSGKFDYDATIPGLVALDKYTLRFKLTGADFLFPYTLAHVPFCAVAREVVEAYGERRQAHPVGTGPYMLKEWRRAAKIVLEANPSYRDFTWDFQPTADPSDEALVAAMKGKKMPQIGRVEISIIEEEPVAVARVRAEGARLPRAAGDVLGRGARRGEQV